jgi:hypothetical protein
MGEVELFERPIPHVADCLGIDLPLTQVASAYINKPMFPREMTRKLGRNFAPV